MEAYLGTILTFGFNFAPVGWVPCNGQLMAISSNTALFSLLGTTYGGNGQTTFGIPDLRGRVQVGAQAAGPGLNPIVMGQVGGAQQITLLQTQLPTHTHALNAVTNAQADAANPAGNFLGEASMAMYKKTGPANTSLAATSIGAAGGSQPVNIENPYLGLNMCIATTGIYPTRS